MQMMSIPACVSFWASRKPDEPAIEDSKGVVSWRDLDLRTNRIARVYESLGVGRGDYIVIMLPNGREFYEAALAVWKLGATPLPLSPRMPAAERDGVLDLVKPRLIVGLQQHEIQCVPEGFVPDDGVDDGPLDDRLSPALKAVASGGSTGKPKIIVTPGPTLFDPLMPSHGMETEGRHLVVAPLYHNAAFFFSILGLIRGNDIVVLPKFDAEEVLSTISRKQSTFVMLVPTMMQRILKLPEEVRSRYDLSSLRTVLSTGAAAAPWVKRDWISWLGADVVQEIYGGTEATGSAMISGAEWLAKPGSVGRIVSGSRVRILGPDGEDVPAGTVGDIYMLPDTGPGSTYFYLGATPTRNADGWETLGDMGHLDEEGYLFLADRRTDLIISGGSNVYPAEVEAALESFPGVSSSAVIGLPDEDLGARVHAIIHAPDGVDQEALLAHLAEQLVRYKIPRSFEYVDTPLRNEAGKIRRSSLRESRL